MQKDGPGYDGKLVVIIGDVDAIESERNKAKATW